MVEINPIVGRLLCRREHATAGCGSRRFLRWPRALALSALVAALVAVMVAPARAQCTESSPCVTTPIDLGTLGGSYSYATGVNIDGTVVVGYAIITGDSFYHAFRWTSAGMVDLGTLGGTFSVATGVNGDGLVVVGYASLPGDFVNHAFRWTGGGGMIDLGTLGGNYSAATGVNVDGTVVVGYANTPGDFAYHAFRWTSAGMVDLGTLGGTYSYAIGVSGNGLVVVGYADIPGDATQHAFRWTSAGMIDLGTLGGTYSIAHGVNGDGSVVVGSSYTTGNAAFHAFRWTSATGIRDLNTLLTNAGVNMSGITLIEALGVSGNGQFIVGYGDFSGVQRAYIVRYYDGVPAGLTTPEAVQQSINDLAGTRFGLMAQQHGFVAPLLGFDKPMGLGNEVGAFAAAGSATGGGFMRYSAGKGWTLLGGISYQRENYPSAELHQTFLGALALQYVHDGSGWWRPFAEVGGWIAPGASLSFLRSYMNGAGTATVTGATRGDLSYIYGRVGVLLAEGPTSQLALSGEIGHEQLRLEAYTEQDAGNPFPASVAAGTDRMDVAKARLQWSHQFTQKFDGTLWVAGAHGFNRTSGLVATVPAIGTLTPAALPAMNWVEYGARVGYRLTDATTLDVFANGLSGDLATGTRVHVGGGLRVRF